MPEIFQKDGKVNVIEYGDNVSSFPLWDSLRAKLASLFKK